MYDCEKETEIMWAHFILGWSNESELIYCYIIKQLLK